MKRTQISFLIILGALGIVFWQMNTKVGERLKPSSSRNPAQALPSDAHGQPSSDGQIRANCQTRDFRSRLPEVREQDSIGWCFGFTAADLISFRFHQNFSPMDVSINHYRSFWEERIAGVKGNPLPERFTTPLAELEGGDLDIALRRTRSDGACLESQFMSDDYSLSEFYTNLRQEISTLERYATRAQSQEAIAVACSDCPSEDEAADAALRFAPRMSREDAIAALRTIEPTRVVEYFRNHSCPERVQIDDFEVISQYNIEPTKNGGSALTNIQRQLNQNNIVGISYASQVLINPKHSGNDIDHASSVIGQRWNAETNQCEFLLRNSWGRTCAYLTKFTCGVDADGDLDGHVWIPAVTLSSAIRKVDYLE